MTNPAKAIIGAAAMLGAALVMFPVLMGHDRKAVQAGDGQVSGNGSVTEQAVQADKGRQPSASAGKRDSFPRKTVSRRMPRFIGGSEAEGTAGGTDRSREIEPEIFYQQVAGRRLGMYLAAEYPGSRVLILSGPNVNTRVVDREDPLTVGLKEEIAGKLPVVAEVRPSIPADKQKAAVAGPGLPEEVAPPEGMLPPMEFWFTAAVFDEVLSDYDGQYDLIVTAIGLPQDVGASEVLSGNSRPRIALLMGSIYDMREYFRKGLVVAAITYNPKAVYDGRPVPATVDEAFAKQFLLVTPETIQQQAVETPDLFRSGN
jgi:hypothetical protein